MTLANNSSVNCVVPINFAFTQNMSLKSILVNLKFILLLLLLILLLVFLLSIVMDEVETVDITHQV